MPDCKIARIGTRGAVHVGGTEAEGFLQGLVTNDVDRTKDGHAVHAGLLTPQGKILFDFLLVRDGDGGFLLDCQREAVPELIKRLTFYKLRAAVEIEDRSESSSVWAAWGGKPECGEDCVVYADPRFETLGARIVAPAGTDLGKAGCAAVSEDDYHAHRIALGIPESGLDYALGNTFPHEADYDQLDGVDFHKGCFVGQEVVARMQHRGTARKRIVPVEADGTLEAGAAVSADGTPLGTLGSVAGTHGLAMLRLDRADKALSEGKTLEAGGVPIRLVQPEWAKFTVPAASRDGAA